MLNINLNSRFYFAVTPAKIYPSALCGAALAFLPINSLLITSGDGFDYCEQGPKTLRTACGQDLFEILMMTAQCHQTIHFMDKDKMPLPEFGRAQGECHKRRRIIFILWGIEMHKV